MRALRNAYTFLTKPEVAREFLAFTTSRLRNAGKPVREYREGFRLGGFTGFTEYFGARQPITTDEVAFLRLVPASGGHVLDVGANLGFVTLLIATQNPACTVHAFEANPSTFDALMDNLLLNNCVNVVANCVTVADSSREILFHADPKDRFTASIASSADENTLATHSITVDEYCAAMQIEKIDMLKIDVEGYECLVLRGAQSLLARRAIDMMFFEVGVEQGRRSGHAPVESLDLVEKFGYRVHKLVHGELLAAGIGDIPDDGYTNFIALP